VSFSGRHYATAAPTLFAAACGDQQQTTDTFISQKESAHAMTTLPAPFAVTRSFEAPRTLVWKAWSEAEHLANWWGPKDFPIVIKTFEFREGGVFLYSMDTPGGMWWGRFIYKEIKEPGNIIFVNSFSDETGGISRAPFSESWPLQIENELTLMEQEGKTLVTLQGFPVNASEAELSTFAAAFDSLQQGFRGTFDQLDAYLTDLTKHQ
jgi:uncharacterized protein YndB with AHSA1/START domain